jgi:hypothetical protein
MIFTALRTTASRRRGQFGLFLLTGEKLTAAMEREWSECVRRYHRVAISQIHCSSVLKVDLTVEDDEESDAGGRASLRRSARGARAGSTSLPRPGGRRTERCRSYQLADLLATSASAFDRLHRQIVVDAAQSSGSGSRAGGSAETP